MRSSIPDTTLERFVTFGDLLRYLRRSKGLTQLELSTQVGYSHAQISRLEQNLRLPDITTIEARFVPALWLEDEPKTVSRLLELAANVRREDAPGPGLCPYKGLNYFDESDADLFVGRESLSAKLTEKVLSLTSNGEPGKTRFLAVVGASGSGKSSLARAGLVPSLRWNKASADWNIHILTPTAHPLESLGMSLTQESGSVAAAAMLMDDLGRDPRSLHLFAKREMKSSNGSRMMLVVDQFEELFASCRSEEERVSFIGNLLTASSEADGQVIVVITLRADFYAHCANHIYLRETLAQSQEYIGAMNDDELRRAIEEPARRGRWEFEPGLVDLLLHDVGHEPGALPLLSHALLETWQRRRGRTMTHSGYTSSGGVRGAIAETAEAVFTDKFTHEQRTIARRIFLRLTELGDETTAGDTRRRASFEELILKPEEKATTHIVLKALADARLVITSEDSAEVAHEALIREWPTLRGWLEDNRAGLHLHRNLTEAAQEWVHLNRMPDGLYRGTRLAQAREWISGHQDETNALEREFLEASQALVESEEIEREAQRQRELGAARTLAEAQRQRAESERQRAEEQTRSATQLRKRAYYLTGAFVVALVMAATALFFARQAETTSGVATSRELAAASISNLEVDPERSILLALQALETTYTIEAEDALHQAIQASRVQLVVSAHEPGSPMSVSFSPDGKRVVTSSREELVKVWDVVTGDQLLTVEGHYAVFSPDGKQIASSVGNGTVKLWEATTGKEISIPNQIVADIGIAFSPDGSRLATSTLRNTPKIWDAKTGKELVAFRGHTDYVLFTYFSPDGTRLLTVSDDGTARVWNAYTGEELLNLDHQEAVAAAAFSPDGQRIVTASGNGAHIWDSDTGGKLVTLIGHKSEVYTVVFSLDGTQIATGSADRKIKIWDAITGAELYAFSGHIGGIWNLAFSPDGIRLATGSDDGTWRLWDITPSRELFTFFTTNDSSGQLAFSADGTLLATTEENGMVIIRDALSGKQVQSFNANGFIYDLGLSPDGKQVVTTTEDRRVRMWNVSTGSVLETISDHTAGVGDITFNKDGTRLVTASDDYRLKIWDTSKTPSKLLLTLEHPAEVRASAFDPDEKRLVTGVQNGMAIVWDPITGKVILDLRGHLLAVNGVTFNPDGSRIATASADGTAKIWDATSGSELFTLRGHTGELRSIAYSPDGKRIATASSDGTAKIWDAETGQELLTFFGDGSGLFDVVFSLDGTRLATGGYQGIRVYLLKIDDLIALAQARVTRSLTSEECQKYLHLDQSTCSPAALIPTTTAMPPAANGRVCQVTDSPGLYDDYFNETIFNGLQDSSARFRWDVKVLQSATRSDFEKNITEFLRGDCDLIVGSAGMLDAIRVTAEANPNQKFLLVDNFYDQPVDNVQTPIYAADQAAFLAGYVAASVTKTGKIGVFGGIDIPPVTDFMDGFALGVAYYNEKNGTSVEVLGWDPENHEGFFAGGFCCAAEGRKITEQLLDAGADIILPVAGKDVGAGAIYAVQSYGGAYFIGVDNDWAISNPQYADIIITSIMKNLDVSVMRAVKAIEDGTFTGGVHIGILETGEVGLAPFHELDSLISTKVQADLEQIKKDIISGKIKTKP